MTTLAEVDSYGVTDDERIEYQELNEFARHDDTVSLAVSSVLLPALLAALAWAWTQPLGLQAPLALGSLIMWLYWAAVTQRRMEFAGIRYRRAWELECKGDLHHHLRVDLADRSRSFWWRWQGIKNVELLGSLTLFGAWMWLLLTHFLVERSDIVWGFAISIAVMVVAKVAFSRNTLAPPCDEPTVQRNPARVRLLWGAVWGAKRPAPVRKMP